MPAPGEQHQNTGNLAVMNPFEEVKPKVSEYTAQEIATLQSRLEKQLGPEYISARAGPGGQKVHYIAAEKCIQLANEVFGFNGWSSQIMNTQVDFVDESPQTGKVSLGLSVIVRVTLRDGTYHEDVGYGHIDNCKGKAPAFEKAKKEGTTDALKRALRNFGNVLGNCIYDKDYLGKVTKVKVQPTKFDVGRLHRHSTYAPVNRESELPKPLEDRPSNPSTEDALDDEFGDFDEADFSVPTDPDAHPDEVILPASVSARDFNNSRTAGSNTNAPSSAVTGTLANQSKPSVSRPQPMAAPARPPHPPGPILQAPQTPNSGFSRSNSGAGPGMQTRSQDTGVARVAIPGTGRVLNQPSRNIPPPAPESLAPNRLSSNDPESISLPPAGAGFFSARAAQLLPEGQNNDSVPANIPSNLPAFNPHAESPSIRKTPGIDHTSSKPLTRDLKHAPSSSQASAPPSRPNIINPSMDVTRRIGAPGSPSPMANRGQYKAPTLKRPMDQSNTVRAPLVDLPANEAIGSGDAGDVKRQRVNGP
ncbi:hypothetical protein BP5796_02583 [Coleophoma crateriformis]|uniref:RAD52 homolog n=1 Tax=Coleophoma crateriformis TaxID=565419 RepID=A0A3D8T089_9HELO|nr:hypothetical protein BP5796_02583 [Coleophoma crateriformis]